MTDWESTAPGPGDRRREERRQGDRRKTDRRLPAPVWRRPWALVGYGVLGALAVVLLVGALTPDGEEPVVVEELATAPPPRAEIAPAAEDAVAEDAFGAAGFERLVIRGEAAAGQTVRTELYCAPPTPIAVNRADRVERAVAALEQDGRVPAAQCKWGLRDDERREDFLLLVPPELADEFAAAPVVTDNFVERRRLRAQVEWIGRSRALALRTAGVFRGLLPAEP